MPPDFDAVVLAGGGSVRMGGRDKCAQTVGGRPLLDHVLAAVTAARRVVVVGPRRPTGLPVRWTQEDPPGGGPVAALAAALPLVDDARPLVVLAGDQPFAGTAVARLLAALGEGDAAVLVDRDGREQYLLAAYRPGALRDALARLDPQHASMRALVGPLRLARVSADGHETLDCDTPADLDHARSLMG